MNRGVRRCPIGSNYVVEEKQVIKVCRDQVVRERCGEKMACE
jgi:hypothetical protein